MEYLSLPLVLREGYLGRANLDESIMYSVGLILSSRIGSMHFNPEYGCGIWEKEFADLYTTNKADIRANLRNAISKYEKRLYDVSISFTNIENAAVHQLGLAVKVSGHYRDNNQEKKFEGTFHIG